MKKVLLFALLACFCLNLSSCSYSAYAPVLSFDYDFFTSRDMEISPFDAPREGYVLIGSSSQVYDTYDILYQADIDTYSANEMSLGVQTAIYRQYIAAESFEIAIANNADAIFGFTVRPNTLCGFYNNSVTSSYVVDFVMARRVNADGSYVNAKMPKVVPVDYKENAPIGIRIDSTRCLELEYNAYYKEYRQCNMRPSSEHNNGYCKYHQPAVK